MKKFGIVLDPGHGGSDAGAVKKGLQEKDLNLAAARRMREYMKQYASGILVTRDSDVDVTLRQRIWLANHAQSILARRNMPVDEVLYLSIHWNGYKREAHGGEAWYNIHGKQQATIIEKVYKDLNFIKWRGTKDARHWVKDSDGKWISMYIVYINKPAVLWEVGFTGYDFVDDVEIFNHELRVVSDSPLDKTIEEVARQIYFYYVAE